MHISEANDKLADWLPDGAEHWPADELRDHVLQANISENYLDQLLDYLDYDDVQEEDFWVALQTWAYNNGSGAANVTYGCDNPKYDLIDWVEWSLLPSFLIIALFAFVNPRKSLWPKCCNLRPSTAFPVNLIDSYEEPWMFAVGFAIMTTSILDLFTGKFYYDPDISDWPSWLQGTVWLGVVVVNAIQVSMAYYPILLCLTNMKKHPALANSIGLCYTAVWTLYYVYRLYECPMDDGLEGKVNTAMLAPIYMCYLILNGRFIFGLFTTIRDILCPIDVDLEQVEILEDSVGDFKKTHYYARVQYLLSPPIDEIEKSSFSVRLREKILPYYKGFQTSRRMVCTSVLVTLTLYQLGLYYLYAVGTGLDELKYVFRDDGYLYELFEIANATDTFYAAQFVVKILDDTFWPTTYVSLSVASCFAVHLHWCYRYNMIQLWRGDRSFCPKEKFAFSTKVVASLRFSGYHIGFSLWGALILQLLMWFFIFFLIAVIIAPWAAGQSNIIIELISDYWLATVLGLVFYYGQVFYARVVFLQGKGAALGLDNRRNFHVTVYITLFLNAVLGLASCLMRILKALGFGILFIGRVDRCTLMRGWELWDPGFKAYIGFMEMEVAHTHPVMVTFCHMMWELIKERKKLESDKNFTDLKETNFDGIHAVSSESLAGLADKDEILRRRRARNRWFIALTLMRNRQLAVARQPLLPELAEIRNASRLAKESDKLIRDEVENMEGVVLGAAAMLGGLVFGTKSDVETLQLPLTDDENEQVKNPQELGDEGDSIMPGQAIPSS